MEANTEPTAITREVITYVFNSTPTAMETVGKRPKIHGRLRQIYPCICASLICVPFGLMLGWPSPTYPILLTTNSPIPISIDQSAMIIGFLMIGNSVGTPFSTQKYLGSKYGITFGTTLMTCGWIIMWQAQDIFWLLGSRLLVGIGHGFGIGQLKKYVEEITENQKVATVLIQQFPLYTFFGMILVFSYGPLVNFRQTSMFSLIISVFILFLTLFLPYTPTELVQANKIQDARKLLAFLKPDANVEVELTQIRAKISKVVEGRGFVSICKDSLLRKRFGLFAALVFFQQFSGAPATLVYAQLMFELFGCPLPEYCALFYLAVFFISSIIGIFVSPKYNKKTVLLLSSIGVSLALATNILVIAFEVNQNFWKFTSVVIIIFFIVIHTVGLRNIPFTLIVDLFPKDCRVFCGKFFVITHSLLALIITKIFQVLFANFPLFVPFCLFLAIALLSTVVIIVFVPKTTPSYLENGVN